MAENMSSVAEGTLLWQPSDELRRKSRIQAFMRWLRAERGLDFADYASLWQWSVGEIEAFWRAVADYFELRFCTPPARVLDRRQMPGGRWFEGATVNYAEHALARQDDHPAVIYRSEDGGRVELSYAELAQQVARARAGLVRLGVSRGDRVAAYLPNAPEALIAFLATASLGAIWSSAASEFGADSVLDRFRQVEPKVLFAVDAYPYGGKRFDRRAQVAKIRDGLVGLEHTVLVSRLGEELPEGMTSWQELVAEPAPLTCEPVPFEHPLWVLYSSGTTGLPKPIVHGHGGILLELYKTLALHCDLGPDDRFFWFSTTGWMMWNFLVSGLLLGATVVLYEGSPGYPDLYALWQMAAEERVRYFGTSAPFLMACKKAGIEPGRSCDLRALRSVGTTGAPLPPDGFAWVYEHVGQDLLLGSVSGGTDVCTAFLLSVPLLPVRAGELQVAGLGCKVEAFDPDGRSVVGEVGELVLTEPMPSMPLFFWNDPDGQRYRESYFEMYPGVWRHGDWIKMTERASAVIYGRSDATLNRAGVRMGTSELYRVVDGFAEIANSLAVDTGSLQSEGKLWLFVVPTSGVELDDALAAKLRAAIRKQLSPRHVPDEIRAIADVPRTLSGKKLEVPLKRILNGAPLERVVNPGTLANPEAVDAVIAAARG